MSFWQSTFKSMTDFQYYVFERTCDILKRNEYIFYNAVVAREGLGWATAKIVLQLGKNSTQSRTSYAVRWMLQPPYQGMYPNHGEFLVPPLLQCPKTFKFTT